MRIHVVFDGPPSHESGRFVEVENDAGASINAGEWKERPDGLWELVFDTCSYWNGEQCMEAFVKEHIKPIDPPDMIKDLARMIDGRIDECALLPDGSGFATMSMPLPKDHWLFVEGYNEPPMPLRIGTSDPSREVFREMLIAAGRYAVRASTMNGKEVDFDPDAMVGNFVVGMLGYYTHDGLSHADDILKEETSCQSSTETPEESKERS